MSLKFRLYNIQNFQGHGAEVLRCSGPVLVKLIIEAYSSKS